MPSQLSTSPGTSRVALAIGAVVVVTLAFFMGGAAPDGSAGEPLIPVLDAEFDFLGAVRTWKEEGSRSDPFEDMEDDELVAAGRFACLRATDEGMNFDGMRDLLKLGAHETFAVLAEAQDKLCPSHRAVLSEIMEG